jgi:hypothetical protein
MSLIEKKKLAPHIKEEDNRITVADNKVLRIFRPKRD